MSARTKPSGASKTIDAEIAGVLIPLAIAPKWKRALVAYHKAISVLAAGSGDWTPVPRARDRLYAIINEAAAHAPSSEAARPIVEAMSAEISKLPTMGDASERGRVAREKASTAEIKRLREAEWAERSDYEKYLKR